MDKMKTNNKQIRKLIREALIKEGFMDYMRDLGGQIKHSAGKAIDRFIEPIPQDPESRYMHAMKVGLPRLAEHPQMGLFPEAGGKTVSIERLVDELVLHDFAVEQNEAMRFVYRMIDDGALAHSRPGDYNYPGVKGHVKLGPLFI